MRNLLLTLLLLSITVVWGWTFKVVKDATAAYGFLSFLAIRFAIGSACLAPFGARRITKRCFCEGLLVGVALAGGYLFQTIGLRYTTSSNSGLITSLFVVFAPLINRVVYGVQSSRLTWAATGVSFLGLVLLTWNGSGGHWSFSPGDLLTLGAAVCFGAHIAFLDHFSRRHDTAALATTQVLVAAALFVAAAAVCETPAWPPRDVWFALVVTGVLATAGGFLVQTLAQRHLPASRIAILCTLETVFAVLFGYLLAGDRFTILQMLGATLLFTAVVLAEVAPTIRRRRRQGQLLAPRPKTAPEPGLVKAR